MELIYYNICDFPKNIETLVNSLPSKRQLKMYSYIQKSDQLRSLAGGLLLSYGLGEYYATQLCYNAYGKPYLNSPYNHLFFNLSHSGDYVVLAISDKSVGVDVQQHESGNYIAMSKISFHTAEQKYLASCNDKCETFYKLWTLKESYMKAVGKGFSLDPTSFEISLANELPRLKISDKYSLYSIAFYDGYSLALCAENPLGISEPKQIYF